MVAIGLAIAFLTYLFMRGLLWTAAAAVEIKNRRGREVALNRAAFGLAVIALVVAVIFWQQQAIADFAVSLQWLLN